jgi:hypothetical protein
MLSRRQGFNVSTIETIAATRGPPSGDGWISPATIAANIEDGGTPRKRAQAFACTLSA